MLNRLKKNNRGFTIIEVMIVLAIAALIMLIIFLAIPALQRNSRNTNRKSDIGRIGAAVTTVLSDNNGDLTSIQAGPGQTAIQAQLKNLGYYQTSNVYTTTTAATAASANGENEDTVRIFTGAICGAISGGGRGATTTGATTRSVAINYATESGSGTTLNCIDQ